MVAETVLFGCGEQPGGSQPLPHEQLEGATLQAGPSFLSTELAPGSPQSALLFLNTGQVSFSCSLCAVRSCSLEEGVLVEQQCSELGSGTAGFRLQPPQLQAVQSWAGSWFDK